MLGIQNGKGSGRTCKSASAAQARQVNPVIANIIRRNEESESEVSIIKSLVLVTYGLHIGYAVM
jgi:hypothetical protein